MRNLYHHQRLSIILATFNCQATLHACLNSIAHQTYPDIEVIIVDGDSKDGTLEIIKNHKLAVRHLICEPDNGIYEAWNKALAHATGDWLYFIGADDELYTKETVAHVMRQLRGVPDNQLLAYGSVLVTRTTGKVFLSGAPWTDIAHKMESSMVLNHQGVFHSKRLFNCIGGFDESLQFAADYKFILQALNYCTPVFLADTVVARQFGGGKSALRRNRLALIKEFRRVQSELLMPVKLAWISAYFKGLLWNFISHFTDTRA